MKKANTGYKSDWRYQLSQAWHNMFRNPYDAYDQKYQYWNDDTWNLGLTPQMAGPSNPKDVFTYSARNNPQLSGKFSEKQIDEFDLALKFFSKADNGKTYDKHKSLESFEQYKIHNGKGSQYMDST